MSSITLQQQDALWKEWQRVLPEIDPEELRLASRLVLTDEERKKIWRGIFVWGDAKSAEWANHYRNLLPRCRNCGELLRDQISLCPNCV